MTKYQVKDYTKGHLRNQIIKKLAESKTYRTISSELGIASIGTISRWAHRTSLDSKSSAPHNPYTKYTSMHIHYLYVVKKYLDLPLDDCIEFLEKKCNLNFKRSSASYYLNKWKLTKKFKSNKNTYKKFKDYDYRIFTYRHHLLT